jgi:hypothetical protein
VQRYKSWTLTDVASDLYLDTFTLGSETFPVAGGKPWSIRKRTLRGGLRDGVDLIEVDNGSLSFAVLPTRGMGLWHGRYHSVPLGWRAPLRGPVHPKFVQTADHGDIGWLTGFDEWLCRCGLAWNGPPGEDAYTDAKGRARRDKLSLHGRIANQPAHYVEVRVNLDAPYELSIVGVVAEAGLFYPHLELTTTYTTVPGSNRLVIHDRVVNRSAEPGEMQLLYHCNVGQPLLDAGSRVVAPIKEVAPVSPRAAEGIDTLDAYAGPAAGFAEQVYCYDLLADPSGRTLAMLYTAKADKGLVLRFNRRELPCFTVWKNTAALEDGYVTGLEPATNYPNFKTFERQQGRVVPLSAGGTWEATWSLEVHDTPQGVADVLKEIVALQAQAKAIVHRQPQPKYSSQAKA